MYCNFLLDSDCYQNKTVLHLHVCFVSVQGCSNLPVLVHDWIFLKLISADSVFRVKYDDIKIYILEYVLCLCKIHLMSII